MKTIEKNLTLSPIIHFMERVEHKKTLFIDIETTGLSPDRSHVYLVGCLEPLKESCWHMTQWLAESPLEERTLLRTLCESVRRYEILVHFNGDRFDLPFLQQRCQEADTPFAFTEMNSLDLYAHFKKCKRLCGLPNGKQKTFESFLGIMREDRYDGGKLIPVYHEYVKTGDPRLEHLLLLHNEEDIIGMSRILPMFLYEDLLEGNSDLIAEAPRVISQSEELLLSFPLIQTYPSRISFHNQNGFYGIINKNILNLRIPLFEGEARFYLPNPKDYYYLPEEDVAMHKSVADYVDKRYRRQATAKTCYIKKAGLFFLLPKPLGNTVFYLGDREFPLAEYSPQLLTDVSFWNSYLRCLMAGL